MKGGGGGGARAPSAPPLDPPLPIVDAFMDVIDEAIDSPPTDRDKYRSSPGGLLDGPRERVEEGIRFVEGLTETLFVRPFGSWDSELTDRKAVDEHSESSVSHNEQ